MTFKLEDIMKKLWIKYLGYIILIFIYLIYREYAVRGMEEDYLRFNMTTHTYLIIPFLLNIGLGILLGLENLVRETRKEGIWRICWPKIICLVIPLLYLSIAVLFQFSGNEILGAIIVYPVNIFLNKSLDLLPILQIMCGYFIMTSIYKQGEKRINLNNFINKI